jgi:hypothetical protein
MAAVPQLERIAALVVRLGPLGGKQRGNRIEADEWNALVEVLESLLEIERAQERSTEATLEERFALKDHKHIGDIGLESLDPDLRSRLADGGGSISARLALNDVVTKVEGLGAEVGRVTATVEEQQRLIDRTAVDELERSTRLRGFEDRFAGVEGLRGIVGTLTGEVQGVKTGVDSVLALRDSLRDPTGAPIDLRALRDKVADLDKLRENLSGVDGKLLRLRDFEVQIKEIQDVVNTRPGRGLDARFGEFANEVDARVDKKLDERGNALRGELTATNAETRTALANQVKEATAASRTELEATFQARVGEAEGRLNASLGGRVDQAREDLRAQLSAEASALVDAKVPGVVAGAVATAKADLRTTLRNQLSAELDQKLATRVTGVQATLEARAAAQDAKLEQVPTLISDRVDQVLPDRLETRLDVRLADLDARIGKQVDATLADLDQRVGAAVGAALPDRVKGEVVSQIGALDVDSRLKEASAGLVAQFRSELAAAGEQLRGSFRQELQGLADTLRGELELARAAAVQEAVAGAEARVSDLRASVARELADVSNRGDEQLEALRSKIGTRIERLEGRVFPR